MMLRFNNKTIYESYKLRYLGIILDHRFTWKHHIYELSKKLYKTIGVISRLKQNSAPKETLITIYHSLFRSYLNYGLSLWGTSSDCYIKKIEKLQNKIVRMISNAD